MDSYLLIHQKGYWYIELYNLEMFQEIIIMLFWIDRI